MQVRGTYQELSDAQGQSAKLLVKRRAEEQSSHRRDRADWQASNITDVLAVPGDFSLPTETVTGQANITIPGMGAVLLNAGRTVTAPDGSIDFRAGPQDFLDYALGNTDVINELCAALGAN